jgi:hypothetical protein
MIDAVDSDTYFIYPTCVQSGVSGVSSGTQAPVMCWVRPCLHWQPTCWLTGHQLPPPQGLSAAAEPGHRCGGG